MWLLWWCTRVAPAEVVDRVVAVVDGEPILASDLRLDEALRGIDPSPVPFWEAPTDPLTLAIHTVVLRHLAADVALYAPSREAVTERITALRQAFEAEAALAPGRGGDENRWERFLQIHGLGEQPRIEAVMRRRLLIERYLLRNVQASPEDRDRWLAECMAMLEQLRRRPLKIREVPAGTTP